MKNNEIYTKSMIKHLDRHARRIGITPELLIERTIEQINYNGIDLTEVSTAELFRLATKGTGNYTHWSGKPEGGLKST